MTVPLSWLMFFGVAGVAVAAQVPTPTDPRSIEGLPLLAWGFLSGWSFAGWVVASLKPAVVAMNGEIKRNEAIAGVIQTLAASLAFGILTGLWMLTTATWGDKPVAAIYAYLAAFACGFLGTKGIEFAIDLLKGILERAAAKGKVSE